MSTLLHSQADYMRKISSRFSRTKHNEDVDLENGFHALPISRSKVSVCSNLNDDQELEGISTFPPSSLLLRVFDLLKNLYQKFGLRYLLPLLAILIYMVIGAFVFKSLESFAVEKRKFDALNEYKKERRLFIERIWEISIDRSATSRAKRIRYIGEAVGYFETKMHTWLEEKRRPNWTLWVAMYYSGTIYSTIGYGDIVCRTDKGRIVTVLYAIIGIPLMLTTLGSLGKWLFLLIGRCIRIFRRLSKRLKSEEKSLCTESLEFDPFPDPDQNNAYNLPSFAIYPASSSSSFSDENQTNICRMSKSEERNEEEEMQDTRIPVSVALAVTVGWIFFCAAVFCIWEHDWSYATSCYFFFISLSTIGLGDITPSRKDMMVISFVFVIIGLSLVSMCISVIQIALEDLYMQLLMKILFNYQEKMKKGDDKKDASDEMKEIWSSNKYAKYFLMPLLSKEKKQSVTQKFQKTAKEQGIELPLMLQRIDEDTGLPSILTSATQKLSRISLFDNAEIQRNISEMAIQTDEETKIIDKDIQTIIDADDEKTQTEGEIEVEPARKMTANSIGVQVQASVPDLMDQDVQTDEFRLSSVGQKSMKTLEKKSTKGVFMYPSHDEVPEMSGWMDQQQEDSIQEDNELDDIDEGEDDQVALRWDPVDGMHAEKQLGVSSLRAMFEGQRGDSLRRPEGLAKGMVLSDSEKRYSLQPMPDKS